MLPFMMRNGLKKAGIEIPAERLLAMKKRGHERIRTAVLGFADLYLAAQTRDRIFNLGRQLPGNRVARGG